MRSRSPRLAPSFVAVVALALALPAGAQDSTVPAEVSGLLASRSGDDVSLSWDAVTLDALGAPETVIHYNVYRGAGPGFPIGYGKAGSPQGPSLLDPDTAVDGMSWYYLVTAVDDAGNESAARPSVFTGAPAVSGNWTQTTIDLLWTDAAPSGSVDGYRVYYGESSRTYEFVDDVGFTHGHSLTGLLPNRNYYASVVAVDADGRESPLSNEHIDALAGTIDLRAQDEARLCFGGCPPEEGEIQRNDGREIMVPVDFPEGDWTNITVTFTADSRLCTREEPLGKCGGPPWNPCGDPWDRTASVYLVLDDCIEAGGNCYGRNGNLELIRTITPFGTDAPVEEGGTGEVGPASWTFDITPYASVLTGTKHVGAFIATWVSPGWYATVDFHFSEAEVSPKPPAAGVIPVWFRDGGNSTVPTEVSIPAEATQVVGRLFTTGHGGVACTCADPEMSGTCDEFCSKLVQVLVDGVPVLMLVDGMPQPGIIPKRTDCSPLPVNNCNPGSCKDWNACGCPSCTYNRSGWCPGLIACHENEPCDQDLDADAWFVPGATHNVHVSVRSLTPGASWANSFAVYWY